MALSLGNFAFEIAAGLVVSSTLTSAALAIQTYRMIHVHDRALFGDDRNDGYGGMVDQVAVIGTRADDNEDAIEDVEDKAERNREAIRKNGLL